MPSPCASDVSGQYPEVTEQQAEEFIQRIKNQAIERAKLNGGNMNSALSEAEQAIVQRDKLNAAGRQRAKILDIQAEQNLLEYIQRYPTLGEGLLGFIDGSGYKIQGARASIDAQFRNIDHTAIGEVWQKMLDAGVSREFRNNELTKEVYIESAERVPGGKPGRSGSVKAQKIAEIIDTTQKELTARMNRAGAWVSDLPGYLVRQTHDMMKIRAAGETKEESFQNWRAFILPKLDALKTFAGEDPNKWLRTAHSSFYTGVQGYMDSSVGDTPASLATKASQERIIHFKSPEDAWDYNERFGFKELKQQVMTDITVKARAIALMENLGGTPEQTLQNVIRKAQEATRDLPDGAKQIDSIDENKILAAYRQITGINDIPQNPSLAKISSNIRIVTQMIDMGRILLTNMFSDRAFLHVDALSQGIPQMQILSKQVQMLAGRTAEQKKTLRLMGVGLDSVIGNALSRYSGAGDGYASRILDKAQKAFFDINFHNAWSDSTKSGAASLIGSWLGQHAEVPYTQLPDTLRSDLSLYDITAKEWDTIRKTAYEHPSNWGKVITPDQVKLIPRDDIVKLLEAKGTPVNHETIARTRDKLWTNIGTYISDRTEYAVPTGGTQVRRLLTQDTKAGTPVGEALRLMGLFKSFPMTIATKVIQRQIYGRGNLTAKQWLLNDHMGKFNMAQMVAMTTVAGYLGMTIRDVLDGKKPRELVTDGKVNWDNINEAALRGGGLGLMGEMLATDYDKSYRTVLGNIAGPVLSKLNQVAEMKTRLTNGEDLSGEAGKFALDNTPLINLFYIRPILNYYVLWNLQEMLNPGSLERSEAFVEKNRHQEYFIKPSQQVN